MNDDQNVPTEAQPEPSAPPQRPPYAGGGGGDGDPRPRRFSARRKLEVVQRLLRGEALENLSRELNVTAAKLSEWRDKALAGALSAMRERERDERDDELARLKAKVGEITMSNELLEEKIARLEAGCPLGRRRSRR
jgi:transposase